MTRSSSIPAGAVPSVAGLGLPTSAPRLAIGIDAALSPLVLLRQSSPGSPSLGRGSPGVPPLLPGRSGAAHFSRPAVALFPLWLVQVLARPGRLAVPGLD